MLEIASGGSGEPAGGGGGAVMKVQSRQVFVNELK